MRTNKNLLTQYFCKNIVFVVLLINLIFYFKNYKGFNLLYS